MFILKMEIESSTSLESEKQEESLDEEKKKKFVIKFKWFHSRLKPEEECNLVEKKSILKITKFLRRLRNRFH